MLDSARGVRKSIKPAQPISAEVESPKWARKAHPERVYCDRIPVLVRQARPGGKPDSCSEEDAEQFFCPRTYNEQEKLRKVLTG